MADESASSLEITSPSDKFRAVAKSVGLELKERLRDKRDSATKTYGFDLYETQPYLEILKPLVSHEELMERHSGGKLHKLEICVSTKTIKHNTKSPSDANPPKANRKAVWLLAVYVDEEEEEDKIGRSLSLDTRFNVVEGEIFVGFDVI